MPTSNSVPGGRTFFGHPVGLFILFFTEMWERFSYYGMRSLLVLYMVNHLFLKPDVGKEVLGFNAIKGLLEHLFGPMGPQPLSSQIYGLYTAFVYLTPFFGGMLADRILGQRRTVILGAVLMAIGHFLMAVESLFFPALMFLILGNGAFKPNISTQVGGLYPEGDPRRDRAFTIFYMGINLGAFFSPLVCGTLGQTLGWHYGFAAAGVGMVLGLILYLSGQKYLAPDSIMKMKAERAAQAALAINDPESAKVKKVQDAAAVEAGLGGRFGGSLSRDEWKRVFAVVVLCAINVIFWGVYEQQGNVMQLWADRNTNWHFLGFNVPSTWYQAFNPFMIFIFAPLLNQFWAWQTKHRNEPSSVVKMGIGCLLVGLSYVVMIAAAHGTGPDDRRTVMWLVGMTFIITIGELYLSPIGLSFVTKVAPAKIVSMMMGVWFLANFFGNYLSGYLGTFWEKMPRESYFLVLTVLGVVAGGAIFVLARPINKVVSRHDRLEAAA
jgi:proton-dependent oligopeptide transporter, POT family